MRPLPTENLRSNVGTWAVPSELLPSVASAMRSELPAEKYDPAFLGQRLETTYFDTSRFALRKARQQGKQCLTLRLRCYRQADGTEAYALSAKTEEQKWRQDIDPDTADILLGQCPTNTIYSLLPTHLHARLAALIDEKPLQGVVCVHCRRYAVENGEDRLTLDVGIRTDTGKVYPTNVLEQKSTDGDSDLLIAVPLRSIKLSKFLWSTQP